MKRARHILYATDFSPASRPAFATALQMAKQDRARLHLLHVLMPPSPFLGDELPASYVDLAVRARREIERQLAGLVAQAKKLGVRVDARLTEGVPSEEILRAARRQHADLIVIGTHGRTGLGRIFMGSVAERVLQRATSPVLTVRARR
jgi:nucleotide-binding universal stress UspA family protein